VYATLSAVVRCGSVTGPVAAYTRPPAFSPPMWTAGVSVLRGIDCGSTHATLVCVVNQSRPSVPATAVPSGRMCTAAPSRPSGKPNRSSWARYAGSRSARRISAAGRRITPSSLLSHSAPSADVTIPVTLWSAPLATASGARCDSRAPCVRYITPSSPPTHTVSPRAWMAVTVPTRSPSAAENTRTESPATAASTFRL
jgi:hypothetical protein